jgi:predicted DNA binding CopG/RHH family protein
MSKKLKKCEMCNESVEDLYETDKGQMLCGDCFATDFLETFDETDDSWLDNVKNWKVVRPETKPITLRINVMDIQRAKKIAKEKNMPYQTYLKEIIHKNLA